MIEFAKDYNVPRSSLPSDFSGDCESVEVLHKRHCEELMKRRTFFLAEESQAMGETCDKNNTIEDEIIRENERNFKNISID